jgi:hypothetical protein
MDGAIVTKAERMSIAAESRQKKLNRKGRKEKP